MQFTVRFGVDCEQRVLAAGQWLTIGRSWNRAIAESRACTLHEESPSIRTAAAHPKVFGNSELVTGERRGRWAGYWLVPERRAALRAALQT